MARVRARTRNAPRLLYAVFEGRPCKYSSRYDVYKIDANEAEDGCIDLW
jgi:hypothetical protein